MNIAPIKTHRDYRRALKEIEGLMDAKRNTPDGNRLDVLVTLVEAFERRHRRLDLSGAAASVTFSDDKLVVVLADGRELAAPLAWFPRELSPNLGDGRGQAAAV